MKPLNLKEIKQILKEKNINYDELALMTKIPKSTLSQIMCGYIKKPSHESIIAIHNALGITLNNKKDTKIQALYDSLNFIHKDMLVGFAKELVRAEGTDPDIIIKRIEKRATIEDNS